MRLLATVVLITSLVGCGSPAPDEAEETTPDPLVHAPSEPGVITITAEDYSFTAPPTFPSGWVTLRFHNEGEEPHFLFIIELPEGQTFDDIAIKGSKCLF